MPICGYRRCSQEFVSNPKHIGSDNEQKFCCRQHGVNERSLIRSEQNRKPILSVECGYRLCDTVFETRDTKRLFCITKHQRAEQRLRILESKSKDDFKARRITEKQKQKARQFAVLHCMDYLQCVGEASKNGNKMACYQCDKMVVKIDAYRDEIEPTAHDADEYSICLPSTGRAE